MLEEGINWDEMVGLIDDTISSFFEFPTAFEAIDGESFPTNLVYVNPQCAFNVPFFILQDHLQLLNEIHFDPVLHAVSNGESIPDLPLWYPMITIDNNGEEHCRDFSSGMVTKLAILFAKSCEFLDMESSGFYDAIMGIAECIVQKNRYDIEILPKSASTTPSAELADWKNEKSEDEKQIPVEVIDNVVQLLGSSSDGFVVSLAEEICEAVVDAVQDNYQCMMLTAPETICRYYSIYGSPKKKLERQLVQLLADQMENYTQKMQCSPLLAIIHNENPSNGYAIEKCFAYALDLIGQLGAGIHLDRAMLGDIASQRPALPLLEEVEEDEDSGAENNDTEFVTKVKSTINNLKEALNVQPGQGINGPGLRDIVMHFLEKNDAGDHGQIGGPQLGIGTVAKVGAKLAKWGFSGALDILGNVAGQLGVNLTEEQHAKEVYLTQPIQDLIDILHDASLATEGSASSIGDFVLAGLRVLRLSMFLGPCEIPSETEEMWDRYQSFKPIVSAADSEYWRDRVQEWQL